MIKTTTRWPPYNEELIMLSKQNRIVRISKLHHAEVSSSTHSDQPAQQWLEKTGANLTRAPDTQAQ